MTRDQRLERLERQHAQIEANQTAFAEQLTEQIVRIRYLMGIIKLAKKSSPILAAGGETQVTQQTAYEAYCEGGRDKTLAMLENEYAAAQEFLAQQEANGQLADSPVDLTAASPDLADAPADGPIESRPELLTPPSKLSH